MSANLDSVCECAITLETFCSFYEVRPNLNSMLYKQRFIEDFENLKGCTNILVTYLQNYGKSKNTAALKIDVHYQSILKYLKMYDTTMRERYKIILDEIITVNQQKRLEFSSKLITSEITSTIGTNILENVLSTSKCLRAPTAKGGKKKVSKTSKKKKVKS